MRSAGGRGGSSRVAASGPVPFAVFARAVVWALGVLCAVAGPSSALAEQATAVELKPDDFAYGLKVLTPSDAAAYRVVLPLAVYQKVVRGDLGDVCVFNERDEVVPYRVERSSSQSTVQAAPAPLSVFPLRGDSREALDAIRVTIESGGTRVDVQAPVTSRDRATAGPRLSAGAQAGVPAASADGVSKGSAAGFVASYIVDGRALQLPVAAFQLSWPDDAPDFAGRLRVEASEDLGSWHTVVSGAPVANLRRHDARITEQRVELMGVSAKFWRLSWADSPAPFEITAVIAEPARDRVDVARATLAVPGTPAAETHGEFEFDLGAQVPVDRVNLELPEQNSIVEVDLLSRARPNLPWQPVTRGGFYRLKSTHLTKTSDHSSPGSPGRNAAGTPATEATAVETSTDLTNSPLAIGTTSDRYWLARVDTRNGGLGGGIPKLRVGWLPHEVVFLARGAGPFTIAYGSGRARMTPALRDIPQSASIVNATLADPRALGGDSRLQPGAPSRPFWSKSTVLWTILGIGVALLAFMAYRLAKELK